MVRVTGIIGSPYRSTFVVNAKNKPRLFISVQIGFIGQSREIFSDIVSRKAFSRRLEFNNLIFPLCNQCFKQFC